ncbi:CDP-diacylglycerol--glycerol-3-phosphate 3-phosphatidyltransferase [Bombella sp. TMW 2.2543]|uniref:CDP-diacylglycerol--glycerol-3-phosphate 3-phosphatidyltransferase n=1 Tax=Bombella pluederhausensis TaxID=2967336 RepID=A0ABT3WEK2_9PROT|nr:CDP-diacylglycerol--glycerol-3-phosphate 3-phosphatidyltransferase [Bombella pluederhausensis]MCX5617540.1 CDP-diacylglycerol--glycerol-3-phosphate 3-phosphatidyltransferase [Bombella pluederhausensis]
MINLPNLLTLFRILVIPVLVGFLAVGGLWADLAFLFYVGACVTDYLDGALARKQGLTSDLGRMMDPIADKLLVGGLLLALAGMGGLRFGSLYAAILIMLREILISGLREYMASHNEMIPSTRLAKWKTGVQMVAIGFLIIGQGDAGPFHEVARYSGMVGAVLLWLSVVPTLLTGTGYLRATVARMRG